jgi:flagellin
MRINHNIPAMVTQGALFGNNRALSKDLEKLSTGLRVNRSSDDAAGLSISEGLRAQVRGTEQAKRNTLDAISALNIAEGAANEIHNILQRMRELSIQSSTATYSSVERTYMNQEYGQLQDEIQRIVKATNFNNIKLLDSAAPATTPGGQSIDPKSIFVTSQNNVPTAGGTGGDAIWCDANGRSGVDSIQVGYESISIYSMKITRDDANIYTATGAQMSITQLDNAIASVSRMRADIGAYVNRLETTVNNLTVSATNQQAAESQIRDVDFAFQSSNFTKNQILTQSATAMLSQANGVSQNVLSLLR